MDRQISQLISSAETGDEAAASALFAALYRELHVIAERELLAAAPSSLSAPPPSCTKPISTLQGEKGSNLPPGPSSWPTQRGRCGD